MNLGNTIKYIRIQKEIKQNALAQCCGISQAYLSQIENNRKEPNMPTLKIICNKLNITIPILFFLAIDSKDIALEKRNAFDFLIPSINSLISESFEKSFSVK